MKEAKNPSGRIVVFNEGDHTYTLRDTGERLESCTKFVKSFFPKFDVERQSAKSAVKYDMPQEDVKKLWDDIRDKASDKGNTIHEYAEAYILGRPLIEPEDEKVKNYCNVLKEAIDYYKSAGSIVGTEIILFSPKLGLAGTTDLLLLQDDTLHILDWKTNKEIKRENSFYRDSKGLQPITHLDNCNYAHYSLQLNFYKTIIVEEGYFPEVKEINMAFTHIQEHDLESYKVYDMSKEVWSMINENGKRAQTNRD